MSFLTSLILGIVQALTEFLPVSSSAHLKLVKTLMHDNGTVLTDLSCHLGTSIALIIFLRKDIIKLFCKEPKKLFLLFVEIIPLVPFYFLLKPLRDYASQLHLLGFCLMGTGVILLAGQSFRMARSENEGFARKIRDVFMIGTLQSAALIPGISRSASTISCARVLGWEPKEAVRFSFLLSVPTILAGNAWELIKASKAPEESFSLLSLFIAFATSFLLGMFIVKRAVSLLEKGNLRPFAGYCFILGIILAIYYNL